MNETARSSKANHDASAMEVRVTEKCDMLSRVRHILSIVDRIGYSLDEDKAFGSTMVTE